MQMTTNLLLIGFLGVAAWGQVQNLTYFKLPGTNGITTASTCYVNDTGAAAGTIWTAGSNRHQAYSVDKGEFRVLEDLPGYSRSFAAGINNKGEVLGSVAGPDQFDRQVVVWKNGLPTPVSLPALSAPGNRRLVTPGALDNAGRILVAISELTPENLQIPTRTYILDGNKTSELPPLTAGGAITSVFVSGYVDMNNSGAAVGQAQVVRQGNLEVIGFIYHKGKFTEVVVDQLFMVSGINQQGEVFGMRYDNSFYVWKNGQVRIYPPFIATDSALTKSWNTKGQTCAWLRAFRFQAGTFLENAIVSFSGPEDK
jgi:hypothetical protein